MRILNLTATEAALLPAALAEHVKALMLARAKARDVGQDINLAVIDVAVTLRKRLANGRNETVMLLMGTPTWEGIARPVVEAVADLFGPDVPSALADALRQLQTAAAAMAAIEARRGLAVDVLLDSIGSLCADIEYGGPHHLRPRAIAMRAAMEAVDETSDDIPPVGEHFERIIQRLDTEGNPA